VKRAAFRFRKPGRLVDGDLTLVLVKTAAAIPAKGYVPCYQFQLVHTITGAVMGRISLRIGSARHLRYPGHIGYQVEAAFRGHRYAGRSCRLLFPLARAHGLRAVWLTVVPANQPSIRTCLALGAEYRGTVRIPRDHEMALSGRNFVRRYRVAL
jgi:tagatose 1,6-diphosphate aldolase